MLGCDPNMDKDLFPVSKRFIDLASFACDKSMDTFDRELLSPFCRSISVCVAFLTAAVSASTHKPREASVSAPKYLVLFPFVKENTKMLLPLTFLFISLFARTLMPGIKFSAPRAFTDSTLSNRDRIPPSSEYQRFFHPNSVPFRYKNSFILSYSLGLVAVNSASSCSFMAAMLDNLRFSSACISACSACFNTTLSLGFW